MDTISKGNTPMDEPLREPLQILESILNQVTALASESHSWPAPYEDDVPAGAD
jgi:hypothetical protein